MSDNDIELPKRKDEVTPAPAPDVAAQEPVAESQLTSEVSQQAPLMEAPLAPAVDPTPVDLIVEETPVAPPPTEPAPILEEPPALDLGVESAPVSLEEVAPIEPIANSAPLETAPEVAPLTEAPSLETGDMLTQEAPVLEPTLDPGLEPTLDTVSAEEEGSPVENQPTEKLGKKLVVEDPGLIEKPKKSSPLVSFLTLIIIIAILVAAGYFFVSQGYIKLPDNFKLPFGQTTTTTTTTTAPIIEEPTIITLPGVYSEIENKICPETASDLTLNEDNTFIFNDLKYNASKKKCDTEKVEGTYTAVNGVLTLTTNKSKEIVASYTATDIVAIIKITGTSGTEIELQKEEEVSAP